MKIFLKTVCSFVMLLPFCNSDAQTAGGWSYNGTKTYTNPLGNFVGIGTNSPGVDLDVQGNVNPAFAITNLGQSNSQLLIGVASCEGCFSPASKAGDKIIRATNADASSNNNLIFDVNSSDIKFLTDKEESVSIKSRGTLGQGCLIVGKSSEFTKGFPMGYRLFVNEGILTEKIKVSVKTTADWSDFVFDKNYKLMPLNGLEKFINQKHHLPNIPSAESVVENGVNLVEMDAKLLQKIEELTLYIIQQDKKIEQLEKKFMTIKK